MVKEIRPVTGSIETVDAAAEPTVPSARAEVFYAQALRELAKLDLPFLLAGTYALSAYTGVTRATKDLDIVCKPADYPRVLNHFRNLGYTVAIEDERWLGKVFQDEHFFDVIFAFWHGMAPVSDQWFESAPRIEVFGTQMRIIAPTELIWSKAFVQLHRLRSSGRRRRCEACGLIEPRRGAYPLPPFPGNQQAASFRR